MQGSTDADSGTHGEGQGVSFMENKANWHGVAPKPEEAEAAIQELEAQING